MCNYLPTLSCRKVKSMAIVRVADNQEIDVQKSRINKKFSCILKDIEALPSSVKQQYALTIAAIKIENDQAL